MNNYMQRPKDDHDKLLTFLSMFYEAILLAATVVAYKIVSVFGLVLPASSIIVTLSYPISDVIAETYGKQVATRLLTNAIIIGFIFALVVDFAVSIQSPEDFALQEAFEEVFSNIIRFTMSGSIGMLLCGMLNIFLITKFCILVKGKFFILRSIASTGISLYVSTVLAGILTFNNILDFNTIMQTMTNAFVLKLTLISFLAIPASMMVFFIKRMQKKQTINTVPRLSPRNI